VLVVATGLVYAPVRDHAFLQFDDQYYVTENPAVKAGLGADSLAWAFTSFHAENWHPLTWLSHMLDWELYGADPTGHHLTNVALHAASGAVLYLLLLSLTGGLGRSFFAAGLFLLHPLRVESVAWVAERKDVLSVFLGLLTIAAWTAHVRRPRPATLLLALALFAAALLAKPMLVTLPVLLLLLDFWPLGRLDSLRPAALWPRVREKLPFFALAVASSTVTLLAQSRNVSQAALVLRVENALVSYTRYLGKTLWPTDLVAFYPHPVAWPAAQVAGSIAVLVAVSVLAIRWRRSRPYLAFGWLWYLVALAPAIGVMQVGLQSMADRYTYLPHVGLLVAGVWGAHDALGRLRQRDAVLGGLGLALLVACALLTRAQLAHWKDTYALWSHALAVSPENYFANTELGAELVRRERYEEAIPYLLRALHEEPEFPTAHALLGDALIGIGASKEATYHLSIALVGGFVPDRTRASLVRAQARASHPGAALEAELREQLRSDPDQRLLQLRLARLLGRPDRPLVRRHEAAELVAQACAEEPCDEPWELETEALVRAGNGEVAKAAALLERARSLALADENPAYAEVLEHRLEGLRDSLGR
jgi:hypothetical protein